MTQNVGSPQWWAGLLEQQQRALEAPRLTIDLEVYSEAGYTLSDGVVRGGGLGEVGTVNYAEHPSTEVLCLAYERPGGVGLWLPGEPPPSHLADWVASGGQVEAHNVAFEFWLWNTVLVRDHGFPPLQPDQLHCSQAKCRRFGIPPALGDAARVLGGEQKDKRGKQLIRRLCVPTRWTKNKQYYRRTPETHPEEFRELYDYCIQDVVTERSVSSQIPDLTPYERAIWLADQEINRRGVAVDTETLNAALQVLEEFKTRSNRELFFITAGAVATVDENKKFVAWLQSAGVQTNSINADAVTALLERADGLHPSARRALELRRALAGANIRKLKSMAAQVSADGRLRNQYVFCGADQTGRFTAQGVQLQNLTAKGPKTVQCAECGVFQDASRTTCVECGSSHITSHEWGPDVVEQAVQDIRSGAIWRRWLDVIGAMTGCLRGLLVAPPGKKLVCADYSSVEAMAAAELTGCEWRREVFRTHGNIYAASAAAATGTPLEEILEYKRVHGVHHPLRNGIGKVRELAGGYGGWVGAWKNFGAGKYFDSDEEIKMDVLRFRVESPEIPEMWGGQFRQTGPRLSDGYAELYGLEGASIWAIQNPGRTAEYRGIAYVYNGQSLECRLPSGRLIRYHLPQLVLQDGRFGRPPSYKLVFWGYNTNTQKGPRGWTEMETYGGREFENVDQGASGDILSEALVRAAWLGAPIVMHTHDEMTIEVDDTADHALPELIRTMTIRPLWASDWPIRADGWEGQRYRK